MGERRQKAHGEGKSASVLTGLRSGYALERDGKHALDLLLPGDRALNEKSSVQKLAVATGEAAT